MGTDSSELDSRRITWSFSSLQLFSFRGFLHTRMFDVNISRSASPRCAFSHALCRCHVTVWFRPPRKRASLKMFLSKWAVSASARGAFRIPVCSWVTASAGPVQVEDPYRVPARDLEGDYGAPAEHGVLSPCSHPALVQRGVLGECGLHGGAWWARDRCRALHPAPDHLFPSAGRLDRLFLRPGLTPQQAAAHQGGGRVSGVCARIHTVANACRAHTKSVQLLSSVWFHLKACQLNALNR